MRNLMATSALVALAANKDAGTVTYDAETGEVLETTAVVTTEKVASGVMIAGVKYEVAALVNVPTLSQADGTTVAFRMDAPIFITLNDKEIDAIVEGVKTKIVQQVPINVARVTQLADGKPYEYVCNAMTADNLRNTYPDHTYVGRCFAVTKHGLVPGKQYKSTSVIEIRPTA